MKKEQAKMKLALIFLTAAAAVLRLPAAIPLSWTVETSCAQPATFEAYQGETIDFEAALQSRGKPLEAPLNYSFFWQTNGMGNAYWEAPCSRGGDIPVAASNVLFATWLPAYDVGAKVYNCFIGSPSNIYHAAFQLRLRPSPGAIPNALPLPTPVIDFAKVRVLNPPWSGGGGVDTNAVIDIANATIETNVLVVATTNRVAALETATNNLTSSVSSLQSSKADKSTTYTKSETDEKLAGKLDKTDGIGSISWNNGSLNANAATVSCGGGFTTPYDFEIKESPSAQATHALSAKANRADSGDDDEIATLDADGNPTRSGIAKGKVVQYDEDDNIHADASKLFFWTAEIYGWVNFFDGFDVDGDVEFFRGGQIGSLGGKWYYGESQDDDREIAVKGDIASAISATDPTFSNEVATVARTVTPPPSPTLRLYDEVRQCYWLGKMVNGVMQWEVE